MKLSWAKFLFLSTVLYSSFFINDGDPGLKIYQSDSLYPYEFAKTIIQNGLVPNLFSWYYPPSNYFFPDIFILLPFVVLGIAPNITLSLYILITSGFLVLCIEKWSPQKINYLFFLALLISFSSGWKNALLPFFLPAHHGTGFLLYLLSHKLFQDEKYKYFVFRIILILSDPFLVFACFLPELVVCFKRLRYLDAILMIISLLAIILSSGRIHPSIYKIPFEKDFTGVFFILINKSVFFIYQLHLQSWDKLWISIPLLMILWLGIEWKNKKPAFSISLLFIFIFSIISGGIFMPNYYPIRYFSGILIICLIALPNPKFFRSSFLTILVSILLLIQLRYLDFSLVKKEENEFILLKTCLLDQGSIGFHYDSIGTDYWTARPLRLIMNAKIIETYEIGKELFWIRPKGPRINWEKDHILYLYRLDSREYKQSVGELKHLKICGNYALLRRP